MLHEEEDTNMRILLGKVDESVETLLDDHQWRHFGIERATHLTGQGTLEKLRRLLRRRLFRAQRKMYKASLNSIDVGAPVLQNR